jgi:hypothetical protein
MFSDKGFRTVFAVFAVSPVMIAIMCIGPRSYTALFAGFAIGLAFIVSSGVLLVARVRRDIAGCEKRMILPDKISIKRTDLMTNICLYVFPFFCVSADRAVILAIFLFVAMYLARYTGVGMTDVLGWNFYEVDLGDGCWLTLISKKDQRQIMEGIHVISSGDGLMIDAEI